MLISKRLSLIYTLPSNLKITRLHSDRHSDALVRQLLCGRPSIHDDLSTKPPAVVLDLGCGDGTWLLETAQYWRHTLFFGLDLQNLHPSPQQLQVELGEVADNIKFTYHNFLLDKLPYRDGKFDLVRMANLKWAIPNDKVCRLIHIILYMTVATFCSGTLYSKKLIASSGAAVGLRSSMTTACWIVSLGIHFHQNKAVYVTYLKPSSWICFKLVTSLSTIVGISWDENSDSGLTHSKKTNFPLRYRKRDPFRGTFMGKSRYHRRQQNLWVSDSTLSKRNIIL